MLLFVVQRQISHILYQTVPNGVDYPVEGMAMGIILDYQQSIKIIAQILLWKEKIRLCTYN